MIYAMVDKLERNIPIRLNPPRDAEFEDLTNPEKVIALDSECNAFSFWLSEKANQPPMNRTEKSLVKNYLMWKMDVDAPKGTVPGSDRSSNGA